MQPLFGAEGRAALRSVMGGKPLLAFDFDGTLAPIVARPELACVPPDLARRLSALAQRHPLAVLTGRSVADVSPRLGFSPRFVVGNHGAEDPQRPASHADLAALDALRGELARRAGELASAGVTVEDKGLSIALHYRLAADASAALRCIDAVLDVPVSRWRRFGGKQVVNLVPLGAPDKADALEELMRRSGASGALFVGDDVTDEAVFARAPPHWLTVRIGDEATPTQARFGLLAPALIAPLLDALLAFD